MKRSFGMAGVFALAFGVAAALALAGCAKGKKDGASAGADVRRVRAAHTQTYIPYDFINDKGESDGFEVAVLRAVDDLLSDYAFEFVGTSDDDLLIGVESGKYAVGTKGAWITDERKKKYIIPQHNIAASIIGITFRTEDAGAITDFESFARFSGKLVPIAPQSAQYAVVEDYNNTHPDNQVKLIPSDVFVISDAYSWIIEKRYDAFFDIKLSYLTQVAEEGAAWHRYAGRLSYLPYRAIPTYPLFNRSEQDLADKYDAAITALRANGTLQSLSRQYFGEDIFAYE